MHKPDNILRADVIDELDWDSQIDDSRIVVKADDGTVALTGSVPTYYQAMRAEMDTAKVGGVTSIENNILVGHMGDAITDAELAVAASKALDGDKLVPKGAVTPDVLNGWVTLRGQVRHHYQRQAADHAVGRVDGVLGVTDDVTITNDPIPSDVADRISKAFRRNAIIDDSHITVTNVGNTVYIDGTTGSWLARQRAEDTAWDAPGVDAVVNRLSVTQ